MEKDFRATAVTWMALAGATLPEICSVSGHSLQCAHQIPKHYLALHPQMATSAIGKLVDGSTGGRYGAEDLTLWRATFPKVARCRKKLHKPDFENRKALSVKW